MTNQGRPDRKNGRIMRIGAIAGAVLALVCNVLPHKYQAPCNVVAQVATLTCGGTGGH